MLCSPTIEGLTRMIMQSLVQTTFNMKLLASATVLAVCTVGCTRQSNVKPTSPISLPVVSLDYPVVPDFSGPTTVVQMNPPDFAGTKSLTKFGKQIHYSLVVPSDATIDKSKTKFMTKSKSLIYLDYVVASSNDKWPLAKDYVESFTKSLTKGDYLINGPIEWGFVSIGRSPDDLATFMFVDSSKHLVIGGALIPKHSTDAQKDALEAISLLAKSIKFFEI